MPYLVRNVASVVVKNIQSINIEIMDTLKL